VAARVRNDHVETAEAIDSGRGDFVDGGSISGVTGDDERGVAETVAHLAQGSFSTSGQDHAGALIDKAAADGRANAGASAGDKGDLAGESTGCHRRRELLERAHVRSPFVWWERVVAPV
jgi:hypothetical protein